jgi:hypothetical protein
MLSLVTILGGVVKASLGGENVVDMLLLLLSSLAVNLIVIVSFNTNDFLGVQPTGFCGQIDLPGEIHV